MNELLENFLQNHEVSQKFVGSVLTPYVGASFCNVTISYMSIKNKNLETIILRIWQTSTFFTDYQVHIGNQQYYDLNEYKGHNQKYRIYSVKSLFNNLFIQ